MTPTLPPEILLHIISFLPEHHLAPYACISKQWQSLIERRTFSALNLTSANLPAMERIVNVSSRRISYIHEVSLLVTLPEYRDVGEVENEQDCERNNDAFTAGIQSLFTIMNSWSSSGNTRLCIRAQSPTDWTADPDSSLSKYRQNFGRRLYGDILHLRYIRSILRLSSPALPLPVVSTVTALKVVGHGGDGISSDEAFNHGTSGDEGYRQIAPSAVLEIARRLPRLTEVNVSLSDNERFDGALRTTLRNDVALSLKEWPASIKHLRLRYPGNPPANEANTPPQISAAGQDAFCIALNALSQQLVTLQLEEMTVGSELFWPPHAPSTALPRWPHLTHFALVYKPASTSGTWLFECDPRDVPPDLSNEVPYEVAKTKPGYCALVGAEQDWPESLFRSQPTSALNEIYKSSGLAAQHMPALKRMVLRAQIDGLAPTGEYMAHWFRYLRDSQLVQWAGYSEFHPTDGILKVWRDVGKEHDLTQIDVQNMNFTSCPTLCADDYDYVEFLEEFKTQANGFKSWQTTLLCR